MTLTLVMDEEPGDRLEAAFAAAFPGRIIRLPTFAVPEEGLARAARWQLCVRPDLATRIRQQGWRDGLILAVSRAEFEETHVMLSPRDSLLFHDLPPETLPSAVRLATEGITVFPHELAPSGEVAARKLHGLQQLGEEDRAVMVEMALGASNREIAARLDRTVEKVRLRVDRILKALECRNRTEVATLVCGRLCGFLDLSGNRPPRIEAEAAL
jgi:DNA-binding CsgD family transcriptional regulator